MERYPYLVPYLKYVQHHQNAARATLVAFEQRIKKFLDWLRTNTGYCDAKRIKKEQILQYRTWLEGQNYSLATMREYLSAVNGYLGFLVNTQVLENSPYPAQLPIKGEKPLPTIVPTPEQIFQIRLAPVADVRAAFYFELLLSSGMRREEAQQCRACDFNFKDRPWDKELNRPSPYFAGSVQLALASFHIKKKWPRKVYFSVLAGKLFRQYCETLGIPPDSNIPLYVWDPSHLCGWMRHLGWGIVGTRGKVTSLEPGTGLLEVPRQRGFLDLDVEALDIPERLKRKMKERQVKESELEDYKRQASALVRDRNQSLHPHALRHSFTNFMLYRNPMGERGAADHLRILLGHRGLATTFIYLRSLDLIQNDADWQRLWLGKPDDWQELNLPMIGRQLGTQDKIKRQNRRMRRHKAKGKLIQTAAGEIYIPAKRGVKPGMKRDGMRGKKVLPPSSPPPNQEK